MSNTCIAKNIRSFCICITTLQPKHHQMQINIEDYPTILSNDKKKNVDDDRMVNPKRKEPDTKMLL